MVNTHSFAFRLPIYALALCLLAGGLILGIGNWQTTRLADAECDRLGRALAAQSAEVIRPYILHNDLVSLQVHVKHLVTQTAVSAATISDPQQRQLAHSGARENRTTLKTYRKPVLIEGKTAAHASVQISVAALRSRFQQPMQWTLAIWGGFTLVLTGFAFLLGRRLSKRLSAAASQLPGEQTAEQGEDELAVLEQRLQPLLTASSESRHEEEDKPLQIATMALHCKNLEKLEAQLSKDKFQGLLNRLDDDIDQLATLYEGQRRPGREQTLFIEFSGDTDSGDHPVRALFCAHILLQLADCYARSQGVAMELSAAAKLNDATAGNALLSDFEWEKREIEAARLAHQGEPRQILVDSATSLHHSLEDVVASEELSESADLHQITSFSSTHQALLDKQLRYLTEQ